MGHGPSVIWYRVSPLQDNYLFKSEWEEIWLVYKSDDSLEIKNEKDTVRRIKENWFEVTRIKGRYIGG